VYVTEKLAPSKAGAIPRRTKPGACYPQEFQDSWRAFITIASHSREWSWRGHHRRDLRGYLSAERGGLEVEIPQ